MKQLWLDLRGYLLVISVVGFLNYWGYHFYQNSEANDTCYDTIAHVREMSKYGLSDEEGNFQPTSIEYHAMIPMLDKIAKDSILTEAECGRVVDLLEQASELEDTREKRQKLL